MLLKVKDIGGQTVKKIIQRVEDVDKSVDNLNCLINCCADLPTGKLLNKISQSNWDKYRLETAKELQIAQEKEFAVINYLEKRYPQNLLDLIKFPVILYAKGNLNLLNYAKKVAIIGTRTPTSTAIKRDIEVTKWFSEHDYVIVSGLAVGCDTYAHRYAQKTIAVLAHGLDQPIYPAENTLLAEQILAKNGLLISTFPLGTKPMRYNFAARDEWQSGLSDGVIVIETGFKGGTMITVKQALQQPKPIGVLVYEHYDQNNLGNRELLTKKKFTKLSTEKSFKDFDKKI